METLFFIASKVIWGLIRPDTWIVIGAGLAFWWALRGRARRAAGAAGVTFAATLALAILPLGDMLLRPLEARHPAAPDVGAVTGIIVLGGGEDAWLSARWDQAMLGEGGERLTESLALALAHPDARIVFTGGSGSLRDVNDTPGEGAAEGGDDWSGAAAAERFYSAQGVDPARITYERASRNTAENARLTHALVASQPGETWLLVTSAFHMPRSVLSFEAAGWEGIVPWPVDYRSHDFGRGLGWDLTGNLQTLNTAVRERIGLIAYGMTGQ